MRGAKADSAASVLRCELCNKPFDKHSTLKRHGYYCRSRNGAVRRPRSCVSCARAKTACNNGRPACSRCVAKCIDCCYPSDKSKANAPAALIRHFNDAKKSGSGVEHTRALLAPMVDAAMPAGTGTEHQRWTNMDVGTVAEDSLILPPGDMFPGEKIGEEDLAWNNTSVIFDEFLMSQAQTDRDPDLTTSLPYSRHATPKPADMTNATAAETLWLPSSQIPKAPSQIIRSLIQRPKIPAESQRVTSLILHTLKSYPRMMMHSNALPPFIHPKSLSIGIETAQMEPLINCISLVRMIFGGLAESRKIFWRNVRSECERWIDQYMLLDEWELVTAMQALAIYILIWVDEGSKDDNTVDYLLVKAVTVIAHRFAQGVDDYHGQGTTSGPGLEMTWKDWVLRESKRRLGVVYRVVNMLFYFEPAAMCNLPKELAIAPLPAKRQLWEADSESSWKTERQTELGLDVLFGLAAGGEIVQVDESSLSCDGAWRSNRTSGSSPRHSNVQWEDWCSGMDAFSGLVMLAASLIV